MVGKTTPQNIDDHGDFWVASCPTLSRAFITVSIIIPAFTAEATLLRAVHSALAQTMQDIEVIVIDDASSDASWDVILGLQLTDPRLRGIRNKENCGKSVAMNRAIAHARGRWIAVLDADDWYDQHRLAMLIAAGEASHADLVADNQFFFDGVAGRLIDTAWKSGPSAWNLSFDDFLAGSDAYESFNLGMLKPVVRADFIRRSGLAYEEQARNGQDFFYLLQFYLLGGRAVIVDDPLYYYTQPFGAVSRQWSHAQRRRYDFLTAYNINRRYLSDAAARMTPRQRRLLKRRNRQLRSLEFFFQIRERLVQGDVSGAVIRAGRCPVVFQYVLSRIRARFFAWSHLKRITRIVSRARRLGAASVGSERELGQRLRHDANSHVPDTVDS